MEMKMEMRVIKKMIKTNLKREKELKLSDISPKCC